MSERFVPRPRLAFHEGFDAGFRQNIGLRHLQTLAIAPMQGGVWPDKLLHVRTQLVFGATSYIHCRIYR